MLNLPLPERREGDERMFYANWAMPFREGAEIELVNGSGRSLGMMLWMSVDQASPEPEAMTFFARYQQADPWRPLDWEVLETAGPGRLVGVVLSVDRPTTAPWAAGDYKLYLDGQPTPTMVGVGLDSLVGADAPLKRFTRDLHGVTLAAEYGKSAAFRLLTGDAIFFHRHLRFVVEHLAAPDDLPKMLGVTLMWYAADAPTNRMSRLTPEALKPRPLRVPGALEFERIPAVRSAGSLIRTRQTSGDEFSAGAAVRLRAGVAPRFAVPWPRTERVLVQLRTQPGRPFTQIRLMDGAGGLVGTATYRPAAEGWYTLGEAAFEAGDNELKIVVAEAATLDCLLISPAETKPATSEPRD